MIKREQNLWSKCPLREVFCRTKFRFSVAAGLWLQVPSKQRNTDVSDLVVFLLSNFDRCVAD